MTDLLLVSAVSVVAAVLALFGKPSPLLGTIAIVFSPGYSLVAALFPSDKDLHIVKRLLLGMGLSIAVVPLVGVVLHSAGVGLSVYPVALALSAITLAGSAVALHRRLKLPVESRSSFHFRACLTWLYRRPPQRGWDRALTVVLALAVAGSVFSEGYLVMKPRPGDKSTEFYILGAYGQAADYPQQLALGSAGSVIVGIVNHEHEVTTYRLEVVFNGSVQARLGEVSLRPEARWEQSVNFTASKVGTGQILEFLLFKNEQTDPYRKLHLLVEVGGT